jgi:transposase
MQTVLMHIDYKTLYEQQLKKTDELTYEIEALRHQLEKLTKMLLGSKHERFVPDDKTNPQLSLALDADTMLNVK